VEGVIITGTEPRQPELRDEPYWGALTDLFNWAEENTCSAVLSCLAAHAGVLHSDGIRRHPLGEKRFGVFEHEIVSSHPVTDGLARPVRIPHSRWNELRRGDLASAGYTILTESPRAGVDFFAKEKKKSLFVHFQGHPEYVSLTLHKEYRRDVKRYLRRERENYPLVPEGYFDEGSVRLLREFQEKSEGQRLESAMESFPEDKIVDMLQHSWRPAATRIYQNWLNYLLVRKARSLASSSMASAGQG
jgi:homoserine O-succinyltransferase